MVSEAQAVEQVPADLPEIPAVPVQPRADQLSFPFVKQFKPLLERFGHDFFKEIPTCPGVYVMRDEGGKILYAGQSENLRKRLAYYKNIQLGREPRRMVRLACQTRGLTWERCATAVEAQIRENELLRQYRPKFNVANTLSVTYAFVIWEFSQTSARWRIAQAPAEEQPDAHVFGAYKSRTLVGAFLMALSRLLWSIQSPVVSAYELPSMLMPARRLTEHIIPMPAPDWRESILGFFEGEPDSLVERLPRLLASHEDAFMKKLVEADLETVKTFALLGPQRHRAIRRCLDLQNRIIRKDELDDFLVLLRAAGRTDG